MIWKGKRENDGKKIVIGTKTIDNKNFEDQEEKSCFGTWRKYEHVKKWW